jgi:hypothetical protein
MIKFSLTWVKDFHKLIGVNMWENVLVMFSFSGGTSKFAFPLERGDFLFEKGA